MLTTPLIHPTILSTLAAAGHGSTILIADGHYPFSTGANPDAERVYLNLRRGLLTVTDVLEAVLTVVVVESASVMFPTEGGEPPIFAEFRELLPTELHLHPLDRFSFYEKARERDLALVIATGDDRTYANILLTMGVAE